jgi:hypothetical protein
MHSFYHAISETVISFGISIFFSALNSYDFNVKCCTESSKFMAFNVTSATSVHSAASEHIVFSLIP